MPRGGNQIGIVAVAAFPARATEYSSRQLRSPDDGPDHPPTRAVYSLTGMPPRNSGSHQTHCWREMDSNFWFLVAKGQTVIRDGTAVSKTGADLLGNRRFESFSHFGKNTRKTAIL